MNKGNPQFTSWTYEGDIAEATKWLPYAVGLLKTCANRAVARHSQTPVPGISIMVDATTGRIHIKASGSLYLESGFLALGQTATCNRDTFLPATLTFNSPIQMYLSSTTLPMELKGYSSGGLGVDTPYHGEPVASGYASKTCGALTLSTSVTDICGNTYTEQVETFGPQDMQQCKYAQRYVPASLYSGKLRLYVQAVYGSTRKDYYAVPLTNNNAYACDLMIGDYRLTQNTPTSGIFTTPDYQYYMMSVTPNQVTFQRLSVSATASGWLNILQNHPLKNDRAFSSRIEAYALSTAFVAEGAEVITKDTGLDVSEGVPMAYGFHFNWRGNQARIVWHRSMGDGTYRARTITLDIADDFTVTGSESSEKAWSNGMYFQFWYPDQYDYAMKTFGVVTGGYTNTTSCPMYGYFDYNDVWREFTISCSISSRPGGTYDTGAITNSDLTGYGFDEITHTRSIIFSGGAQTIGSIGYSIAGDSFSGSILGNCTKEYCSNAQAYDNTTYGTYQTLITKPGAEMREGYVTDWLLDNHPSGYKHFGWRQDSISTRITLDVAIGSPLPTSTDTWTTVRSKPDGGGITYMSYTRYTGYAELAEVMVGIPFNDCESIMYGSFSGSTWTKKETSTANANVVLKSLFTQEVVQTGLNPYGTIYTTTYTTVHGNKQIIISSSGGLGLGTLTNNGSGNATTATVKLGQSMKAGWTHVDNDGVTIKTEAINTLAPSGWAEKYFRVTDGALNAYHPTMIARASANGAHIMYHDEDSGANENGYPNGNYSAVGWA